MKMNDTQTSIDSMAIEMSLDFMASKNTNHFDEIITKYKPPFIATSNVSWYFIVYKDLAAMNNAAQYGGEEVFWPNTTNNAPLIGEYIDADSGGTFTARVSEKYLALTNYKTPESSFAPSNIGDFKTLSNKAFVLTVVCDYQFSSSFVRKFFAGGKNTKGTKFLVWGRSVGVCN